MKLEGMRDIYDSDRKVYYVYVKFVNEYDRYTEEEWNKHYGDDLIEDEVLAFKDNEYTRYQFKIKERKQNV